MKDQRDQLLPKHPRRSRRQGATRRASVLPVALVCFVWSLLILAFVVATAFGPARLQTWAASYGAVFAALIASAITSMYVVIAYSQLSAQKQLMQLQFGAGAQGPKIDVVRDELAQPPNYRVESAYKYPDTYRKKVRPNADGKTTEVVDAVTMYEVVQLENRSEQRIEKLSLTLSLTHSGTKAQVFNYKHPEAIPGKAKLVIGVWPVLDMPNYELKVSGSYQDAVGVFQLQTITVTR